MIVMKMVSRQALLKSKLSLRLLWTRILRNIIFLSLSL